MLSTEDAEARLFGPVDPAKDCGTCVVCCEVLKIDTPDLQKRAGMLCQHNTGQGCGIYADRPPVCRQWHCGWRRLDRLPERFRPDKSDLLVKYAVNFNAPHVLEKFCIVIQIVGNRLFSKPNLDALIGFFKQDRIPVWVSFAGKMKLVHPAVEIARHLIDGTIVAGKTGAEVALWRERLRRKASSQG